ncbi:undecaprenyl/decaprenyl-phosphate alpha-N-acetylglucosaminyl 1-phosphate transferase [Patescibacteria group bacterium]|nr:undecaprenyl/decaprenyl-phosphate alpha-N-acetylglucosaminyl 1-phosphate transferase [Patescibacteria group bacterium]MBU1890354.1 undecaprenyl/decaprenyl-phosphate alpha-N-acetylglucosaminyl 1-phosphate transferase [Patescibacteria group bacterium]
MSYLYYIFTFIISVGLAFILTYYARKLALKFNIVDRPATDSSRKIHQAPMPLLGGLGIFLTILILVIFFTSINNQLLGGYLLVKHLLGVIIGGCVIMLGGYLDDRYRLTPSRQIIFPAIAALIIVASGVGIEYISNPFGDSFRLDSIQIELFRLGGLPYTITLLSDAFVFIWLMGMMYTTKFLDGLDGLSTGITTIGAFIVFFLSISQTVAQPETALLAIIFAGAGLGFLLWNFHPAKVFLGEGGSVFVGFMLGVLSIISGAKIATALLIMGIPILDVIWVIIRRLFIEKKSPTMADNKHLHFRLLDMGLSHRQAVIFLYVLTVLFGITSLFFTGKDKVISLVILVGVMIVLASILVVAYKRKNCSISDIEVDNQ